MLNIIIQHQIEQKKKDLKFFFTQLSQAKKQKKHFNRRINDTLREIKVLEKKQEFFCK